MVMDNKQIEHVLKVMYEEIKQLKSKVKSMEAALDMFATLDLDRQKKRDY
jgi:flagellar motor component MotA